MTSRESSVTSGREEMCCRFPGVGNEKSRASSFAIAKVVAWRCTVDASVDGRK